jgi:hypothetical protein
MVDEMGLSLESTKDNTNSHGNSSNSFKDADEQIEKRQKSTKR